MAAVGNDNPGGAPPQTQPTPTQPQPGAPGQGLGQGDGFRSQFFPNVPDDVWGNVEPHIRGVQGHVTQLEQRYAPLRSYTPEAVQGLAAFAAAVDRDPVGTWLDMADRLQKAGALDPDLDLEHLKGLLSGQGEPEPQPPINSNGLDPNNPLTGVVMALQKQIEELTGTFQQDRQQQRERTEDRALEMQLDWMKKALKDGGIAEDLLDREQLLASYIAHRGNPRAAVESALNYKNALLKGVVPDPNNPKPRNQPLDLPKGAPKGTGATRKSNAKSRSMFRDVEAAAEQFVRAGNQQQ